MLLAAVFTVVVFAAAVAVAIAIAMVLVDVVAIGVVALVVVLVLVAGGVFGDVSSVILLVSVPCKGHGSFLLIIVDIVMNCC